MQQQDFWKWAEKQAKDNRKSHVEGRLDLSHLPPDLRLSISDLQTLHQRLNEELEGVEVVITDNRRRMVSAKKKRGRHRLRLHHMFVGCDARTVRALADLTRGGDGLDEARRVIKNYIDDNRDEISFDVNPEELEARGEYHDLQSMLDKWRRKLDDDELDDVVITWGRYGRGRRTIRFGSYDFDRKLIRIHPALDQQWVPPFFVEFIVYHELLHALFPPVQNSSRRVVHTDEFRHMEERFPRYEEALTWERNNLARFLQG